MKNPILHNPHDALFKAAVKDKEVAIDLLKKNLPSLWLDKIDLSSIKLENSSFISEEMSESHSDVVYSTSINGNRGYVYLLVEAQSTCDKEMAMRLWEYN